MEWLIGGGILIGVIVFCIPCLVRGRRITAFWRFVFGEHSFNERNNRFANLKKMMF
jgi:hypothetical protein